MDATLVSMEVEALRRELAYLRGRVDALEAEVAHQTEVDIFEVVGPKPTEFTANLHLPAGQAKPGMTFYQEPPTADGFHIFGFEWTPTDMRWLIDGKVIRTHANYLPSKPLHPLISWEIGSSWPGKPNQTTPWPAEAEIDYIRVYKKRP